MEFTQEVGYLKSTFGIWFVFSANELTQVSFLSIHDVQHTFDTFYLFNLQNSGDIFQFPYEILDTEISRISQ